MTSTNTYTHSNHYLTLVCNIALKNKYTRWYFNIISRALERSRNRTDAKALLGYVEGHHILPRSFDLGGQKDKINIVYLTAREHFIIHVLLIKMFTGSFKYKMFNALTMFNEYMKRGYFNSRLYSINRENARYLAKEGARISNRKRLTDGTHHLLSKNRPEDWYSKYSAIRMKAWIDSTTSRINNGTHNFLSKNRTDEFKTKNRAGVLKTNNYRIQTGAHNFLLKNRTDEHEITRKQNHLAVCAKPIRIECGNWFCMEYSSISAARKSGFPVGLLEALIKNNGVYTVQRNRKHRSGKSTGTAFMKGHVLKLIYVTIA
jgi:hypothetical protein